MKISLIGPQGSGKTTLGVYISKIYNIPLISLGDVLRNPDSYAGVKDAIGDYDVHSGDLISDEQACAITKMVLGNCPNGWVLDGMPRKMGQYQTMLDEFCPDMFVLLTLARELSITRLLERTKEDKRPDGALEIIEKRLDLFEKETKPVVQDIQFFGKVPYVRIIQGPESTPRDVSAAFMDSMPM